jgi:hypothetical protein
LHHSTTSVTGGCLCGRVRYAAEVFLHNGYACHCTICRRSTGQPAEITVLIRAGTLRYLQDEPQYFQTSAEGKRGFCGTCGSRIVWQALRAEDDWLTNVTVGSLDHPERAQITRHICADTRLPWYDLLPGLPSLSSDQADDLNTLFRQETGA